MDIPSSLLFQNERITDIYTFSPKVFYVTIGIFLCGIILSRILHSAKRKRNLVQEKPSIPPIPWLHDTDFEVKMAKYLRSSIYQIASPRHTYAHTSREIRQYIDKNHLIQALIDIEKAEYNGETLSIEKRREVISLVQSYTIKK